MRDQLKAHLELFAELGVDGMRLDGAWRKRPRADDDAEPSAPGESGGTIFRLKPEATRMRLEPEATRAQEGEVHAMRVFGSASDALKAIREDIGDCTRCKLHALGRKQIVFGVGNPNADLMFVGEAPGADEDIQGEPFVGRAGQLLTRIIEAIGMRREDVYIANVIKCRPPGNRNPEPDEVDQCEQFMFRQVDTIKPKVIVALGKFAAQALLRTNDPITRLRGREYKYRGAVLMPTYHPAYLLRTPSAKREVWEDMKRVREILAG